MKLSITQNCGNCHKEAQKTYLASYHGQVNRLGYTHTAKCFDCHGGHGVKKVDDPTSWSTRQPPGDLQQVPQGRPRGLPGLPCPRQHPRLRQVPVALAHRRVHAGADHRRASVLLDPRDPLVLPRVSGPQAGQGLLARPGPPETVYFRRFSAGLALDPPAVRHRHHDPGADRHHPPVLAHRLGQGDRSTSSADPRWRPSSTAPPRSSGSAIFVVHLLIVAAQHLAQTQDLPVVRPHLPGAELAGPARREDDVQLVLRAAPRPNFDRWTYWQKFDYWAPFWGAAIIGFSRPDPVLPDQDGHDPARLGVQHRHHRPCRGGAAGDRLPVHGALLQRRTSGPTSSP